MSPHATPCTRHLEPTQISMLSEAAPALLTVTDGTLWLTRGDGEDVVLAIGACAEIDASRTPAARAFGMPATFAASVLAGNGLVPAA